MNKISEVSKMMNLR